MREKKVMKLASRGKRFGAACIDAVVPALSMIIWFIAMIALMFTLRTSSGFGNEFNDPFYNYGYGYGYGYDTRSTGGLVAALLIPMILMVIYMVVQIVMFTKSKTIGKAALGLQVVSSENGEPIGFWKMLFREWFVKAASGSVFLLGYIWVLIDDKNRGWHDKILETYVVDLKESELLNQRSQAQPRSRVQAPAYTQAPSNAQAPANAQAPKSAPKPAPQPTQPTQPTTVQPMAPTSAPMPQAPAVQAKTPEQAEIQPQTSEQAHASAQAQIQPQAEDLAQIQPQTSAQDSAFNPSIPEPHHPSLVDEIKDVLDDAPVVVAGASTLEEMKDDTAVQENILEIATEVVRTAETAAAAAIEEQPAAEVEELKTDEAEELKTDEAEEVKAEDADADKADEAAADTASEEHKTTAETGE